MEIPKRYRKVNWACIVCNKECRARCTKIKNIRSIECSICCQWTHEVCASLTPTTYEYFAQDEARFVCGRCISETLPNVYSYENGLSRLVIDSLS